MPLNPSSPVQVALLPQLSASRGKLLSAADRGTPVYAASFIRKRRIVLEAGLLSAPASLRFIFVHELFHFAWVRLGNRRRSEYSRLLAKELEAHARGELGESSAVKKASLPGHSQVPLPLPIWRDYVCESFCDTAACLFTGETVHEGAKLGKGWTDKRRRWFLGNMTDERRWAV